MTTADPLDNYSGSTVLRSLCDITGLQIDAVNFVFCQVVALLLGYFMRKRIHNPVYRLWYTLICGIAICTFCFGIQIGHILISMTTCYLIMSYVRSTLMPWFVFGASMSYLSYLHLQRQFFGDGSYSIDLSGPLMVLTQKLTALAFARQDGVTQRELTPLQKQRVVKTLPSPLLYSSYVFQFQSMLAGPLVFFDDFTEFIYTPIDDKEANPAIDVLVKMVKSIFFAMIFLAFGAQFNVQSLRSAELLNSSSVYVVLYILISTTVERCKYYHAWLMADSVCNLSGLGYDRGKGTWDKVCNVHCFRLEMSLNLKELLDNWNIQTMKWLRFVVYERAPPSIRTNLVYVVSAFWHGFYPGYYITFCSGALFTTAGRVARKHVRPYFLHNATAKFLYDGFTWMLSRVLLGYITLAFVIQDFYPSMAVYIRLYFFLHIFAIVGIYLLPVIGLRKRASETNRPSVLSDQTISSESSNGTYSSNGSAFKLRADDTEALDTGAGSAKLKTG